MNYVFLCVDCLREDCLSGEAADTPFLDGLVAEGLYFNNMYSTATTTTPAVASIFTGCYSEKNGVNTHRDVTLASEIDTLAEILSNAGFSTYALPTGPLVEETDLDRGFDLYEYRNRKRYVGGDWWTQAIETIAEMSEPFFLFLHLWACHEPVFVPDNFEDRRFGDYPYTRALAGLDRTLEKLVEHLPKNTTIFVHGDHGESITWRQSVFHHPLRRIVRVRLRYHRGIDTRAIERIVDRAVDNVYGSKLKDRFFESGHGENISDFTTNVPFLIYPTPEETPRIESSQVRQVDIFPTILDLLDIEKVGGYEIDGETLLPSTNLTDRIAYMRACGTSLEGEENWQRGIRSNEMKYVEYPNRDWEPQVFDLDEDPQEMSPIHDDEIVTELEAKMPDTALQNVDRLEIDDLLRDLGYL